MRRCLACAVLDEGLTWAIACTLSISVRGVHFESLDHAVPDCSQIGRVLGNRGVFADVPFFVRERCVGKQGNPT